MKTATSERIYLSPRARATLLWIVAAVVLLFLIQVSDILKPFIWAIITAYVLNPVVIFLARRTGLPRRLWAVLLYLLLLGLVAWGLGTLVPLLSQQIADFSKELPRHFREAGKMLNQSQIDLLGVQINLNASDVEISRQLGILLSQFGRGYLPGAIPRVAESLLKLLVYLVASFFLLQEAHRIGSRIGEYTPTAARSELGPWVERINHVLGAYIRGQLILVGLMSVASYIALTLLGVRYAPLLAIFTGLVETLPFIGPYIAGGAAVLVALTQGSAPYGWSPVVLAIAVAITYTLLRQLEDNLVMPFFIGRLVHLHPLAVIFAVLSGSAVAGILGLLLAVPVAATVKIVATYLYRKVREEPPRTLVLIEAADSWREIAEHVREAAAACAANGLSKPRLLISAPDPPSALLNPAQFHRLPALLEETHSKAILVTTNGALVKLAEEAGIAVEISAQDEVGEAPEPEFEEKSVRTLLNIARRGARERAKAPAPTIESQHTIQLPAQMTHSRGDKPGGDLPL